MTTFFGADGRQELDLRHFDDFMEALHVELVRLEYCHYDPEGQVRRRARPCVGDPAAPVARTPLWTPGPSQPGAVTAQSSAHPPARRRRAGCRGGRSRTASWPPCR
jgi:hypothetical protein